MPRRTKTMHRGWKKRAFSLLLAVSLTLGMVPGLTLTFAAAHWADGYLDQLVDWGVMRADQTGAPDTPLTRAEFMAIINRAYGYTKTGPIPFTDVSVGDWFYDDVAIAYTAGYTLGTSATTFHPNQTLNREQAVCILARNMMMEETPGENLAFSDARDVSSWARGLVKTAVDNYIINGYPDGSFGPQDTVSKGQMASLIVQCIGTPLNKEGDYALGDVFGNVTITSSGVTLRDTTVSGDLYVSGGVGLGNVKLENVNVLGRIIVSGTGESQEGDASVVLRNVTANEMLVDNMKDQLVTLRAEGLTNIGQTTVRTPAYLEDNAPDEFGLRKIDMQETGARLTLAGRVKEVVNTAPQSTIQVAKGTVAKLTVDEAAVGSTVQLDRNTEVKELNLDTGTNVTGQGDVDKMNVNASNVTSTMLPDNIYIRPGLEANIDGEVMDSAAAEESSLDPRILSGYPKAGDVAPTSLKAEFAGNKRGTIYWGVSSITDGSITAEDLISPPSYGSTVLKNGSVAIPSSNTAVPVQITGLTVGGSYYLSAVLVDARGERSPVKVISFTTPDNTKPAFAQGYPYMSLVTDTLAQATVMATKSCKLYYAVLPQGAQAPTVNDLKSAAVTGNLGYGVMDVVKNTEHTFTVSRQLEEMKNYVAYFWLTDADGANSSNIVAVRFTTKDCTPPKFDPEPYVTETAQTSVRLTAGLNEAGTIYWAVVPEGTPYPLPNNQNKEDNILDDDGNSISAKLESEYAKLQVSNGRNATKRGSVAVRDADTDAVINVTGLAKEAGYDFYYVAKDSAGNFSDVVKVITIKTLDTTGPIVYQYFNDYQGDDETKSPLANSDIILRFNESVNAGNSRDLLTLYEVAVGKRNEDAAQNLTKAVAQSELKNALRTGFKFYQVNIATNTGTLVPEWAAGTTATSWINYDKVVVRTIDGGGVEVVFPGGGADAAVAMTSGSQYYFQLESIRDNSENKNQTQPTTINPRSATGTNHVLNYIEPVIGLVNLANGEGISNAPKWVSGIDAGQEYDQDGDPTGNARVDTSFVMTPQSTQNADPDIRYELIVFNDAPINYDLYYRILDENKKPVTGAAFNQYKLPNDAAQDTNGWVYLGNKKTGFTEGMAWDAEPINYSQEMNDVGRTGFPALTSLGENMSYEFAFSVTEKDNNSEFGSWSGQVNFRAYVVVSGYSGLHGLATVVRMQPEDIDKFDTGIITSDTGYSIGACGRQEFVAFRANFVDTIVPKFTSGPTFTPGDTFVEIDVSLDREATVYYVLATAERPLETRIEIDKDVPGGTGGIASAGEKLNSQTASDKEKFWDVVDYQTNHDPSTYEYYTVEDNYPPARRLVNPSQYYRSYPYGNLSYQSPGAMEEIAIGGPTDRPENTLLPNTQYYIYMVLQGTSAQLSEVYVYNFTTTETARPKINLRNAGSGIVGISTTNDPPINADIDYAFFTTSDLLGNSIFRELFFTSNNATATVPPGFDAGKFTVLDALMATDTSGSSVFDIYAQTTLKETVAEIIRLSSSGQAIRGSTQITNNAEMRPDGHLNEMKVGEYYYMLAVGHHSSGTTDGFKAIYNIVVPDSEPPRISSIVTSGTVTANTFEVEGTVTITFTKPVYRIQQDNPNAPRIAVANNSKDSLSTPLDRDDDYYGILNILGGAVVRALSIEPRDVTEGATQSFTFNIKKARVRESIVIFNGDGRIANESGRSDNQVLTLILKTRTEDYGLLGQITVPYFEVTYKDSDGRNVTVSG